MKIIPIFLFLLLVFNSCIASQVGGSTEKSLRIESEILNENIEYSVYFPSSYSNSDNKTYTVMYLLHGYGGDENSWINRCQVKDILDSLYGLQAIPEMIVVMPDAKNSYYINYYDSSFSYEDFFIKELIPHINNTYKVDKNRLPVVCGLSMGGFGAIILPIKHPDVFSTSISLSAAVRTPDIFFSLSNDRYNKYFGDIFGHNLVGENRITEHWKNNSPYFLLDKIKADKLKKINWYVDCGMQDFLFPANDAFHRLLLKHNIPHEFHMRVGKHNWEYWRIGFIRGLLFLSEKP